MDLQQPPAKPKTEIVLSASSQKDPGIMIMADLLKQVESNSEIYQQRLQETAQLRKDLGLLTNQLNDLEEVYANQKDLILTLQTTVKALENTFPTNLHSLILTAKTYQQDMETLSRNNLTLSNAYIDQFNKNVNLEKKLEALEQEIKQNHDNDVELNKRYLELKTWTEATDEAHPRDIKFLRNRVDLLENKQAISLSQFRCLASGVIGFLAGFLIWFYAHKAELLR